MISINFASILFLIISNCSLHSEYEASHWGLQATDDYQLWTLNSLIYLKQAMDTWLRLNCRARPIMTLNSYSLYLLLCITILSLSQHWLRSVIQIQRWIWSRHPGLVFSEWICFRFLIAFKLVRNDEWEARSDTQTGSLMICKLCIIYYVIFRDIPLVSSLVQGSHLEDLWLC